LNPRPKPDPEHSVFVPSVEHLSGIPFWLQPPFTGFLHGLFSSSRLFASFLLGSPFRLSRLPVGFGLATCLGLASLAFASVFFSDGFSSWSLEPPAERQKPNQFTLLSAGQRMQARTQRGTDWSEGNGNYLRSNFLVAENT